MPLCEESYQNFEMEQLSAYYFSIGHAPYHVVVHKQVPLFSVTRTVNVVSMLKTIVRSHGRPKLVTTDNGPLFCEEYVDWLRALNIDHIYAEGYMPSKN